MAARGNKLNAYIFGVFLIIFILNVVALLILFPATNTTGEAKKYFVTNNNILTTHTNHIINFPSLSTLPVPNNKNANTQRILLVTLALVGPTKTGGIATFITALAQLLTKLDNTEITILYMYGNTVQSRTIDYWIQYYKNNYNINLIPFDLDTRNIIKNKYEINFRRVPRLSASPNSKFVKLSYLAYNYLASNADKYNLVYLHEWHGLGYYMTLAKKQGLVKEFKDITFITTIHCPVMFYLFGNSVLPNNFDQISSNFMEKLQVFNSDIVISPSQFMLKWVQNSPMNWELPMGKTFVQQNLLTDAVMENIQKLQNIDIKNNNDNATFTEYIFFARLELLKGLFQFCDALTLLSQRIQQGQLKLNTFNITFLGHPNLGKHSAVKYIQEQREKNNWPFFIKIITNLVQYEAIQYISQPNRAIILASLLENSPYAVIECLALSIPFLATDVGGVNELIREEDKPYVLMQTKPESIANYMERGMLFGIRVAKPAVPIHQNRLEWNDFHSYLAQQSYTNSHSSNDLSINDNSNFPLITIGLIHHERGDVTIETLDGILRQSYDNIELIVVDDGSETEVGKHLIARIERICDTRSPILNINTYSDQFIDTGDIARSKLCRSKLKRFLIIKEENSFPGFARNNVASHSNGDYIAFIDDDDIPDTNWIATMYNVAFNTKADIVTSICDFFDENVSEIMFRWLPIGNSVSLGLFNNVFGSYSALFLKESFFNKIGGYTEDKGSTYEDWEIFARASIKGCNIQLIPEPLMYHRTANTGEHLLQTTNTFNNQIRALRAYVENVQPNELRDALLIAYGWSKQRS